MATLETTVYIVTAWHYSEQGDVIHSVYTSLKEARKARAHLRSLTDEYGESVVVKIVKRDLLSSF